MRDTPSQIVLTDILGSTAWGARSKPRAARDNDTRLGEKGSHSLLLYGEILNYIFPRPMTPNHKYYLKIIIILFNILYIKMYI